MLVVELTGRLVLSFPRSDLFFLNLLPAFAVLALGMFVTFWHLGV